MGVEVSLKVFHRNTPFFTELNGTQFIRPDPLADCTFFDFQHICHFMDSEEGLGQHWLDSGFTSVASKLADCIHICKLTRVDISIYKFV